MAIEEMLPLALLKAKEIQITQSSNRQGIFHMGYYAEFAGGGRLNVSTTQKVADEFKSYNLNPSGDEWVSERFLTSTTYHDVIIQFLRFPGDRQNTFSPTEEEVEEFLKTYIE